MYRIRWAKGTPWLDKATLVREGTRRLAYDRRGKRCRQALYRPTIAQAFDAEIVSLMQEAMKLHVRAGRRAQYISSALPKILRLRRKLERHGIK